MRSRDTNHRLSRLLAQGDPASSEAELAPEDARWIKAAMLDELSRAPKPRTGLAPLWVAISAALVISGLGLAWWTFREPAAPARTVLATTAPVRPAIAPARPDDASPAAPLPRPFPKVSRVKAPKAAAVAAAQVVAATQVARHLEFQTPGGTRVVWVLDPNFTLGNTEATSR